MIEYLQLQLAKATLVLLQISVALAATPAVYEIKPQNAPDSEFDMVGLPEGGNMPQGQTGAKETILTQGQIRGIVVKYARQNGVSDFLALELAHIESRFDPNAKNPTSTATGIYQFLSGTWNANCFGDRKNPEDNIRCAMRILGEDKTGIRHWTVVTSTRKFLLKENLIICHNGNNNCYLK